jgi:8-oxo-dGTP pyrophosphatase MutT (NUDIX family)
MATTEIVHRPGVRVLVLDPDGRVLLFRGSDPARSDVPPYWFTVGGGLEPGESPVDGAIRETYEETGLHLTPADLTGPVWQEVAEYPFENVTYRQPQDFYLVRLTSPCAVDTSGFDDVELRTVDAHRWWTAAEIRTAAETVYPRCLADLVEGR